MPELIPYISQQVVTFKSNLYITRSKIAIVAETETISNRSQNLKIRDGM